MVEHTKSDKFMKKIHIILFAALMTAFFTLNCIQPALAVTPEAETGEIKSVIEGLKVRQIGSDELLLELRGTKMSIPSQVKDSSSAALLQWKGIRFPRDTDKKDWWDEYEWSVMRPNKAKSNEWWQKFDYSLVQRIQVVSNDQNGVRLMITGEKPLSIKKVIGMNGSDAITLELYAESDVVPPKEPTPARI